MLVTRTTVKKTTHLMYLKVGQMLTGKNTENVKLL